MRSALLGFALATAAILPMSAMAQTPIAEGQVWTFKGASADTARVAIQKIEPWGRGEAVHVSIYGLAPTARFNGEVSHMPFDRKVLEGSLDMLTTEKPRSDIGFAEGYQQWSSANGGIFTLSIADALKAMLEVAFPSPPSASPI
ncbi:MAG TPA: hypothetical protein VGO52_24010 [Hyphomonadaceae bacterium]|nr:hypothetical protein [Hyphomonadaceae bacterium]